MTNPILISPIFFLKKISFSRQLFHLRGVQLFSNQKASLRLRWNIYLDQQRTKTSKGKKISALESWTRESNQNTSPRAVSRLTISQSVCGRGTLSPHATLRCWSIVVQQSNTYRASIAIASHKPHARQKIGGPEKKSTFCALERQKASHTHKIW